MLKLKQDINKIKTDNYLWIVPLIVLCISFSPLLFNFIWCNHDWLPLIQDNRLTSGLIEGRFSQYILLNLLLMGKILPILNIIIGFFFYSISLCYLGRYYFKFRPTKLATTLYISTAASLPYIIEILYFHFLCIDLGLGRQHYRDKYGGQCCCNPFIRHFHPCLLPAKLQLFSG